MDTFKDFRRWLISGFVALSLTIGGYLYTVQASAQATAFTALAADVKTQGERIAKLEQLLESQRDINRELKEIVLYLSRAQAPAR